MKPKNVSIISTQPFLKTWTVSRLVTCIVVALSSYKFYIQIKSFQFFDDTLYGRFWLTTKNRSKPCIHRIYIMDDYTQLIHIRDIRSFTNNKRVLSSIYNFFDKWLCKDDPMSRMILLQLLTDKWERLPLSGLPYLLMCFASKQPNSKNRINAINRWRI